MFKKKKKTKLKFWVSSLLKRRVNYGTGELMADFSTDDAVLNGEINYSFHKFTKMLSTDFKLLINLSNNYKNGSYFQF